MKQCLQINIIDQKGGKRFFFKGKFIIIPLLKTKMAIYSMDTLVFSQVFECSYQRVNVATVKFRKFGIVPVSSLMYTKLGWKGLVTYLTNIPISL